MSDLSHTSFWWNNTLPAPSRYPCYHAYVRFTLNIFLVILLAPSYLQISLLQPACQPYLTHLSGDITHSQLPPDILAIMSMSALPHTSFWWYNTFPAPSRYPCYHVYVSLTSHIFLVILLTPSSLQISLLPSLCQPYLKHLSGDITRSQLPPDILATISMSDLPHTSFWWYYSLPAPSRYPCYHLYVIFISHIFLVILLAPSSLQISLLPSLCQPYLTHLSGDITRWQLPPDILAIMCMSDLTHTSFWWYNTLPAPSRYPCYHLYVRFTSHICSGDITRSQLPPDILAIISMSVLPHTSFWWYNTLPAPSRYPCYHVYIRFTSHIFLVILLAPSSLQISLLPSLCQIYIFLVI